MKPERAFFVASSDYGNWLNHCRMQLSQRMKYFIFDMTVGCFIHAKYTFSLNNKYQRVNFLLTMCIASFIPCHIFFGSFDLYMYIRMQVILISFYCGFFRYFMSPHATIQNLKKQ